MIYLQSMWFNKWTFSRINRMNEIGCWAFEQHFDLHPNRMYGFGCSPKNVSYADIKQNNLSAIWISIISCWFSKSNGAQGISIEDSFHSPYSDSVDESSSQMQDNYNEASNIATATHTHLLLPFNQDNLANMTTATHMHLLLPSIQESLATMITAAHAKLLLLPCLQNDPAKMMATHPKLKFQLIVQFTPSAFDAHIQEKIIVLLNSEGESNGHKLIVDYSNPSLQGNTNQSWFQNILPLLWWLQNVLWGTMGATMATSDESQRVQRLVFQPHRVHQQQQAHQLNWQICCSSKNIAVNQTRGSTRSCLDDQKWLHW